MSFVESFNGTINPNDQLDVYKVHMHVQCVDDATYCHYFQATLKGITHKQFNDLPSGRITSFLQLTELFSTQFIESKKERKTSIHLAKIQQATGEDLKEYAMMFSCGTVLIPDLQDGQPTYLNGLLLERFKFYPTENKVTTLVDALRRA